MLIAQMSDLHVGSQFLQEKFDVLEDEINEPNPDVIVVTGDLTNEGLVGGYERCRTLLERLSAGRRMMMMMMMMMRRRMMMMMMMIAISGNHDYYRNTGYLLFKKFFPFEAVNEFDDDDDTVLVTVGTARPDRNEGEVGYRQNLWLEKTMKKYADRIKIVAMHHHHLIAIPDTGSD